MLLGQLTPGAICSMAYGVRTPIVDGNIHRLFTRLLAVHAPQTAPQTIKFLWTAAEELVSTLPKDIKKGIAGDWNQVCYSIMIWLMVGINGAW
jgi:A/G-specific adenine glycosylase